MKLIASGVTRSAASTRSPSFSRSSSSTRMTMRPARTSSIARATAASRSACGGAGVLTSADTGRAFLIELADARRHEALDERRDVLGDEIALEVHGGAHGQ